MTRLKLTLAYVGTRYHGWQTQARPGGADTRTVQSCIEAAISRITGRPCRVHGSGRTDSGVHALGQVAHCDVPEDKARVDWLRALNALLPDDVSVLSVESAAEDFHARYDVRAKVYAYSLWLSRRYVFPQRRPFVWVVGELDLAAMDRAATLFVGEHDFAAFQNVGTTVASTVREVQVVTRDWAPPPFGLAGGEALELVWSFQADGFLKQMVRNLVGCLVAVGRGQLAAEAFSDLLVGRDRTLAPATAPARGLCLCRVIY